MEVGLTPIQSKHLGAQEVLGDFNALSALGNNSQADAYQIVANYSIFTTVGASTNSAKLPVAESDPYGIYYVLNLGANALNLFPAVGDSFNDLAVNTAISIPVLYGAVLVKQTDTSWQCQKVIGTATISGSNTGDVTLAGTPDYITISGQVITRGLIDLATDVTGVLDETNGGTGQSSIAQGDLLYGSASNVISKLAKDANATRYLANTGTSNNPAWSQVNLANGVTGTLPVANGGTGLTTTSGEYTPTVTNVTNVASSSAGTATWVRTGDYITVAGRVTFDPTAVGYCAVTITLPVTVNNFTNTDQANGTCNGEKGGATVGSLVVTSTSGAKTARISGYCTYSDNTDHRFIFMYKVIN